MTKSAINQFDTVPGNNTDVDGVGVGAAMTVDNTNDAFQHLMALIASQMGEVGALAADLASAATTDLSTARGWFVNITGTNTISAFGTVPAGKIFRLRFVNGLTLTYNVVSMILPNAVSLAVGAGDIVTMLSLGSGNWRLIDSQPASGNALPPGSIVDFGGTTAPGGWLLCNGQAVSRTGYPLLFAAISTAYGTGDGSTTFNVPDFRGRAAIGNDSMGTTAAGRITTATVATPSTNGGDGGAQTVTLSVAQMPAHDHNGVTGGQSATHTHTFADSTSTTSSESANHAHNYTSPTGYVTVQGGIGATNMWQGTATIATGSQLTAHNHTVSVSGTTGNASVGHTHTVATEGGTTAHSNLQPSLVCMKIIKV